MTPREEDSEASKVEPNKRRQHLRVPVFADEKAQIESAAKQAGISVARYLREVGMGYPVRSVVDAGAVRELVRVNADLARLGNLLKLWLDSDVRTAYVGREHLVRVIQRLEGTQSELRRMIQTVKGKKASS